MTDEEIEEMIPRYTGYFVIPKRIYHKFSSRIRLDGTMVQEQMRLLQEMGLSKLVKVHKTLFFYKAIPTTVELQKLAVFTISIDYYRVAFELLDACLTCLTDMQQGAAEAINQTGTVVIDSVINNLNL